MLADRGVLPEIKAALRARSEWRPADDRDLLPTFTRMLSEVATLPTDIVVPAGVGEPEERSRLSTRRLRNADAPRRPHGVGIAVAVRARKRGR